VDSVEPDLGRRVRAPVGVDLAHDRAVQCAPEPDLGAGQLRPRRGRLRRMRWGGGGGGGGGG
jgi:hypothetical protein